MKLPVVSVIMPSYNSEEFIADAINSVISQTERNWELLIVDDGSTDNTRNILSEFEIADYRIKVFLNEKNCGPGPSRNKAISAAVGKWIAFLDADDIWISDKLERQLDFVLNSKSKVVFTHSSYGYLDQQGNIINKVFLVGNTPIGYFSLLKRTEISCLTAMYDQESIGKFYMSNHRYKQDYALWLAILKAGFKSHPQPELLAYYRQTSHSGKRRSLKSIIDHINFLRSTQELDYFRSSVYTVYWIINGVSRYLFR